MSARIPLLLLLPVASLASGIAAAVPDACDAGSLGPSCSGSGSALLQIPLARDSARQRLAQDVEEEVEEEEHSGGKGGKGGAGKKDSGGSDAEVAYDKPKIKERKDDRNNRMPLKEALALDKAAAALFPEEFLPMMPVLYPGEMDKADNGIALKLEGLERDTPILLPGGTTIPYWQTLQYANRNFRLFVTRFLLKSKGGKVWDVITEDERIRVWAMTGIAHKRMLTDEFKACVMARDDIPSHHRDGSSLSAAIFYEVLEHVYRGSSFHGERKKTKASAWAFGTGIKFNTMTKLLDKRMGSFVGLYLHEQGHNMGYGHADKIPWVIQKCGGAKKAAAYFKAYDLAESPDFTVP